MSEEKELSEAEHLIAMKNSQGWDIVLNRYNAIVKEISDLRTIPHETLDKDGGQLIFTTEQRMKEMVKREAALSLFELLFEGISASVDNFHDTMQDLIDKKEEGYIKRIDD